jgi:hypothetical protein
MKYVQEKRKNNERLVALIREDIGGGECMGTTLLPLTPIQ